MSKERILAYIEKLYDVAEDIQHKLQNEKGAVIKAAKLTGTDFENVVYQSLIHAGFRKEAISHSTKKFPDFILEDMEDGDKIGIEVKKTDSSKWEVIGGSIYESLKNEIPDTFVLMAKLGGEKPEVRLRKYNECIADLKVTHSPRFYLDLNLEEGQDYLTKNNVEDLLRLSDEELNKKIRGLLRTQKSTWWSEGETVSYAELSKYERDMYLNDGIALFPEVFGGDYQKFTPWLVYSCLVWCGNVRDIFSAGGNKFIKDMNIYISAIMYRALENVESIKRRILDMTAEEQKKFWGKDTQNLDERLEIWLELVEKNIKVSRKMIKNNRKLGIFGEVTDAMISSTIKQAFIEALSRKIKSE